MKKEISITYIEISKWLKENSQILINSVIKKIKQKDNIFYFKLFNKKTYHLIIYLPYFTFFSNSSIRIEKPTNFQMILRKYIENARIINVYQREFDKILILEFSNRHKLIVELFSDGNLIILDENNRIIDALIKREWKDRKIDKNLEYKFPPNKNLIKKNFQEILETCKNLDVDIVKFLMEYFGLNLFYSQHILEKNKIEKNKSCKNISQRELDLIIREIEEINNSNEFYLKENEVIFIGSINLENSKKFDKINDALIEAYYIIEKKKKLKKEKEKEEKIKKIFKSIEESKAYIENEISKISELIETIQKNNFLIFEICDKIISLRKLNIEWSDIKNIIKKQYNIVKDVDENKGILKVFLDNKEIEIDFRNPRNYLNLLFEKRKKLKEKLAKIEEKLREENVKLEVIEKKPHIEIEKQEKEEYKQWFEKFRWFISSDGYLVVSGKDAETNEELIKKYSREYDLVLHADIHGSPFTLIRNDKKKEIPSQTIYEAAQFTACYSQAWDLGLNTIHVYYVSPKQLVKVNLPKGSFLIKGERNWLEKVKLRLSIGMFEESGKLKVFAAPPVAARKKTQYIITLVPGNTDAEKLVKDIRKHFESILPFELRKKLEEISDEEIKKLIPFGKGDLVKVL